MKPVDPSRLSFLILDYLRPRELLLTLQSIKHFCKCDHEIVVHSNGGKQDYVVEYYNQGLIDRLILNKLNNGAGRGCVDLFNYCLTDYAIYLEGDQPLIRELREEEWYKWRDKINGIMFLDGAEKAPVVSMVGRATQGNFSQRAFFTSAWIFRFLAPRMPNGGPGTDRKNDTNEAWMQKFILDNELILFSPPALVRDMGCFSLNQNIDGSVWAHRVDTKKCWLIKGPIKQKSIYPAFSDQEWEKVISEQKWDGKVPESEIKNIFHHWPSEEDEKIIKQFRLNL